MSEKMPPGIASRIAVSTAVGIGWLVFLILFFAFYAQGYSVYQNIAIFLASVLVVGAILGPLGALYHEPKLATQADVEVNLGFGMPLFFFFRPL